MPGHGRGSILGESGLGPTGRIEDSISDSLAAHESREVASCPVVGETLQHHVPLVLQENAS
jgi:hypothetical protein